VLSPRRAPDFLQQLVADTRLAGRIELLMRSLAPTSCAAVRADQATVVAIKPDQLLVPASAIKLTTAAAFLAEVGGTGQFSTEVLGPKPDAAGTVNGPLTLVGGGDPLLATSGYVTTRKHPPTPATDFAKLVRQIVAAGVERVTGGLWVSDEIYDAERRVPTWSAGYTSAGDVGPIGALAVDDGFASYAPLIAATDPAIAAGEKLRTALVAAGVSIEGPTRRAERPALTQSRITSIRSAPFAEVVAEMLRESDNNTAELLLKEMARRAEGANAPVTRAAGVAARTASLRELGVDANAVQAIDGSGLDRSDRATCDALLTTLTTRPGGYDIETMLPVAGRTGTLDDRFTNSPLVGRLRAKTGSLNNVTALVGVVDPTARVKVRFAFVSNGPFTDAGGKAIQDRLVAALATYPEAPPASALEP
jgi:serine-type D-Ala-D-Ala carboxypeptidase/endopeptidase (penicillin-binding protein 4)